MSAVTFPPPPPPKVFVDRNAVEVVQYRFETYGGKRKPGGMVRYDVHLLRAEDELRQGLQAQPGRAESALGRVLAETRQASIHKSGERKMEEKKEKRKALEPIPEQPAPKKQKISRKQRAQKKKQQASAHMSKTQDKEGIPPDQPA